MSEYIVYGFPSDVCLVIEATNSRTVLRMSYGAEN